MIRHAMRTVLRTVSALASSAEGAPSPLLGPWGDPAGASVAAAAPDAGAGGPPREYRPPQNISSTPSFPLTLLGT